MTIQLSNISVASSTVSPPGTEARVEYWLDAAGDIVKSINGGNSDAGDWISPKSGMSNYECRFTLLSGSTPYGTLGSWLDLAITQKVGLVDSSVAGSGLISSVRVEIRDKAMHTTQASCTLSLFAWLFH